jgi:ribonuclease HI
MSDSTLWQINIDGAARGNPGPAAFAFVIRRDGAPLIEEKGFLGSTTNNLAEYTALVRALEHAAKLGARRLVVHSDSELLVKQMNGEYRVKNESLRELFDEAKQLCRRFDIVTIRHVPRAQNSDADRLCNEALDAQLAPAARGGAPPRSLDKNKKHAAFAFDPDAVREDAVACLRTVAGSWAHGNTEHPTPAQVWEQLWSILQEHGVLRTKRSR